MTDIRLGRYQQTLIPFAKPVEALRTTVHVAGSPGMGKSTLLGNLCEQCCGAGDGVILLDIKGDLTRDIAGRTRYPERVVYVRAGVLPSPQGDRVWTLNPFEGHRGRPEALPQIATNVLESFDRMGRTELGFMANIRQTLQHAIRLAMTQAEPTLLDLLLIVIDQPHRQELIRSARHLNHVTRRFWQDLDELKVPARERRSQLNTTRNRLEGLLMDRELNLFVGSYHSSLRLREWLDEGKMVLIDLGLPLPRGLGVDIGNLIMSQLVTETFLREGASRDRIWRLVVDEFHEFVGDNFAQIITEARSFNVFPILAHQDRSQLDRLNTRTLKSAVGHAGVKVLMATSLEDRVAYASLYGRDQADLVLGLDRYKAMITVLDGLAGTRQTEAVVLDDWWGPADATQLVRLQQEALALTASKQEVVRINNQRYWDRLDATGAGTRSGGSREPGTSGKSSSKSRSRRRKTAAPGARPPQSGAGATPSPGNDPPRADDPDGDGPASLLDGPPDL